MSDAFERAARLVHALGEAGGALPAARLTTIGDAPDLESALATLGDLVSLETDGTLRFGPRGSALAAAGVQASLGGATWGRELEVLAAIGSTNDRAAERAAAGAAPGLVVTAELQTAGRGRRGRVFDSRPGLGIWSTTLLPVPADPAAAPRLSLIAALAVAEAVEERTGFSPALKWPNDVRIGGRKICGVLVEARSAGGRVFPVAGIGINVHHRPQDFPPEVA
ncbi:MAG: biotin--[acetyl-CoA-carboxylase] ligase, partial [Gemmatimonadetes bacterium]|nr:biotin--[acetyl-CoA-carboxylase] ligase [Gemmatimonadota bacterium]